MIDDERKRRLEEAIRAVEKAGNVYLLRSLRIALQRLTEGNENGREF